MITDENNIALGTTSCLDWSMARLPKQGENECGDYYLVKEYRDQILIAAVDGLGHGSNAAKASEKAIEVLESFNNESVINLVNRCHKELRNTRGVVMSLALLDAWEETLTWIGIGNVEGTLFRADGGRNNIENIILRGGVVGYKLPSLQASIITIDDGDLLVFTTDGVEYDYPEKINIKASPQSVVETIASNSFKKTDDALILAARYKTR